MSKTQEGGLLADPDSTIYQATHHTNDVTLWTSQKGSSV